MCIFVARLSYDPDPVAWLRGVAIGPLAIRARAHIAIAARSALPVAGWLLILL
jgi:hypothetical protein